MLFLLCPLPYLMSLSNRFVSLPSDYLFLNHCFELICTDLFVFLLLYILPFEVRLLNTCRFIITPVSRRDPVLKHQVTLNSSGSEVLSCLFLTFSFLILSASINFLLSILNLYYWAFSSLISEIELLALPHITIPIMCTLSCCAMCLSYRLCLLLSSSLNIPSN